MSTRTTMNAVECEFNRDLLRAENPVQFRAMLKAIVDWSGLSYGQIDAKTTARGTRVPRSTANAMVDTKHAHLPGNVDQVLAVVAACGLDTESIETVLRLHHTLRRTADTGKDTANAHLEHVAGPDDPETDDKARQHELAKLRLRLEHEYAMAQHARRRSIWPDLIRTVLSSESMTRRAIRLLWPLVALTVIILAAVTYLIALNPTNAIPVAAALTALVAVPIAALQRNLRRSRGSRPDQD